MAAADGTEPLHCNTHTHTHTQSNSVSFSLICCEHKETAIFFLLVAYEKYCDSFTVAYETTIRDADSSATETEKCENTATSDGMIRERTNE